MENQIKNNERLYFKKGRFAVSTLRAVDRGNNYPYETAIIKKGLFKEEITVVQVYDTFEEAQEGHEYWEVMIISGHLKPFDELQNVLNVEVKNNDYRYLTQESFITSLADNYEKVLKSNRASREV